MARFVGLASALCTFVLVAFFFFTVKTAEAQVIAVGDDTSTPSEGSGHDYIKMLSETVNPANGSVSLRIQAPPAKGRGITLPFSFAYDSNGTAHLVPQGITVGVLSNSSVVSEGGWAYSLPLMSVFAWSSTSQNVTCNFVSGYTFQDPSGGRHNLGLAVASYSSNGQYLCSNPVLGSGDPQYGASLLTTAGSGNINPPAQVHDADGTVYYFSDPERNTGSNLVTSIPDYIEDRNGNKISIIPGSKGGSFTVTDTAGRTLTSNGLGPSGTTNTVSVGGLNYKVAWTSTSPNFAFPSKFVWVVPGNYTCATPFPSVTSGETAISSITLPNGKQYKLYYGNDNPNGISNPFGLLSEIDYPSGGWVRYTWKMSDQYSEGIVYDAQTIGGGSVFEEGCQVEVKTPVVATRTVGFGPGSTPALTQTFTYSTSWNSDTGGGPSWSTKQTSVSTTDNIRGLTSLTTYKYLPAFAGGSNNPYLPDYMASQLPLEQTIKYYDWGNTSTPIRTVNKTWFDIFDIASETTILDNGQETETTYSYTSGSGFPELQTETKYDYGQGAVGPPLQQTAWTYQSFVPTPIGGVIADKPSTVITSDGNGNRVAETDYAYDGYGTSGITPVTATSHDDTNFPTSYTVRGNATTKTQKCFPIPPATQPCSDAVTTYTYDETGQVLSMKDPNLNPTQYSYADSYTSGTPPGNTNAYLTTITHPPTNGISHVENFSYSYADGQLTVSKDQNQQLTTYKYADLLDRPTEIDYPDGGKTTISYNDAQYNPSTHSPSITTTKEITSGLNLVTTTGFDGLGHEVATILSSDPDGITYTVSTYDGVGRAYTVSNPYRSTNDPTYGITTFAYDALGRVINVAEPGGSAVGTSYLGNCTTVSDEAQKSRKSCVDGLGRMTRVLEDPVNLSYETDYLYDPLGNLTCVQQQGGVGTPTGTGCAYSSTGDSTSPWRIRRFQYDSLSRLTQATNPESGTVTYTYDSSGNLITKVAPRPNQTTSSVTETTNYIYDALNRLTQKSYVGINSHAVSYWYDGTAATGCTTTPPSIPNAPPFKIGRRTAMCDGSGATSWSFDPMGRVLAEGRTIVGSSHVTSYTQYSYNLDGSLQTVRYPSNGTVLNYTAGGAGRPLAALDATFGVNYVTNVTYAPNGALSSYKLGGAVTALMSYNNRLQPLQMFYGTNTTSLGSLQSSSCPSTVGNIMHRVYNFASSSDNGDVMGITNCRDTNRTLGFSYDSLNRIESAATQGATCSSCWGQLFGHVGGTQYVSGYDGWGNLHEITATQGSTTTLNLMVMPYNNQFSGMTYNADGGLKNDGQGNGYVYNDAEGRLTSSGGTTYTYDGNGMRVKKSTGTLYWRDTRGDPLAESGLSGTFSEEYIFFNGRRIARRDISTGAVNYYFSDHLGSASVITDANGTIQEESDYYPFGGELVVTGSDANHYKFTGKERDAESGLDYFGLRYDSSSLGRFMTPDRNNVILTRQNLEAGGLPSEAATGYMDGYLENPQNWNQYAYVRNNPLRFVDPTGAAAVDGHHLIISRNALSSPVAQDFADKIKTGALSGNRVPNGPGFGGLHREYNEAVENLLQEAEQTMGDRNSWSVSQWKTVASEILNSEEPAIKNFLDELEANNPGAKAALSAAIAGYRVSRVLLLRVIAAALGSAISRITLVIFVNVQEITNPHREEAGVVRHSEIHCLKNRDGSCVD
jgi:RHS repeat-associated protein